MARNDHWLPLLVELFNAGCARSQFILDLQKEKDTIETGKELCLTLWPFISRLPGNIKRVKAKLPDSMEYAGKFLNHLSDDEGYYQGLYRKQCYLAGIDDRSLESFVPGPATENLCELLKGHCAGPNFEEGILAIVTAELAATVFARHSLELFEAYFEKNPPGVNKVSLDVTTDEGLAWLRLHAKPQTRHAIWMKRAVDDLELDPPNKLPGQVEALVEAIYAFWRCTEEFKTLETERLTAH